MAKDIPELVRWFNMIEYMLDTWDDIPRQWKEVWPLFGW